MEWYGLVFGTNFAVPLILIILNRNFWRMFTPLQTTLGLILFKWEFNDDLDWWLSISILHHSWILLAFHLNSRIYVIDVNNRLPQNTKPTMEQKNIYWSKRRKIIFTIYMFLFFASNIEKNYFVFHFGSSSFLHWWSLQAHRPLMFSVVVD